jgi:hypothetical protein
MQQSHPARRERTRGSGRGSRRVASQALAALLGAFGACYSEHGAGSRASADTGSAHDTPITGIAPEERFDISDPTRQAGPPAVRFVDNRWIVAWMSNSGPEAVGSDARLEVAAIDGNQVVMHTSPLLARTQGNSLSIDAQGRVGLLDTNRYCQHRVFEADLRASNKGFSIPCGDGARPAAAPIAGSDEWLIAYANDASIMVGRYKPSSSAWTAMPLRLGQLAVYRQLEVFAGDSDAVVVWGDGSGTTVQSVEKLAHAPEVSGSARTLGGAMHIAAASSGAGYALTQLQDRVLAFGMNGHGLWGAMLAESIAPIEGEIAPSTVADRAPAAAAAEQLGAVGVCYATGQGRYGGGGGTQKPTDGVSFVLLNAESDPILPPTVLADDIANIGGCAVAWSGEEFLVVYWHIANSPPDPFTSQVRGRRLRVLHESHE